MKQGQPTRSASCLILHRCSVTSHHLASQDVRCGLRDCKVYQEVVHELTVQIQKQPPAPDTIASRLLAVIVRFVASLQLDAVVMMHHCLRFRHTTVRQAGLL